jgi:hypothetical protein
MVLRDGKRRLVRLVDLDLWGVIPDFHVFIKY